MASSPGNGSCPGGADNQFGPRVDVACRPFDFTLLFEDGVFAIIPAAAFLMILPFRLQELRKASVKMSSYRLAGWKMFALAVTFVLHLLFLAFRTQAASLETKLSLASGVLTAAANLAAVVQSFVEDQRSLQPSDAIVLYYSASALLFIPRLRSLWLIPSAAVPSALWTAVYVGTVLVVVIESLHKTKFLRASYRNINAEQRSGFWGRSFFVWVLPLFRTGYSKDLQLDDIPILDPDLEEKATRTSLEKSWNQVQGRRHGLMRAAFYANLWPLLSAVAPRLALMGFSFCQPFLVNSSVSFLRSRETVDEIYGPALLGAFILVYLGIAVSRAVYRRQSYRSIARIRSALTATLYYHTTTLRSADVKDSAAVTLMGTDVERIVDALSRLHEIWASFIEVGIATWLLARQVSVSALIPLAICVVSILGASRVASRFGPAQKKWNQNVQTRVAATIAMISDMKSVKMLGLTGVLTDLIMRLRTDELKASEKFRVLLIWRIVVSNAPQMVAPFVTFAAYAGIAVARNDQTLLSAQAFTSLSLISLLTFPLLVFCQALPMLFQAVSCFDRIEEYLLRKTGGSQEATSSLQLESPDDSEELRAVSSSSKSHGALFTFDHANISWSEDAPELVLSDLNLTISHGLTAIIGPVASGKSTMLASMVGETNLASGSIFRKSSSGAAFCPQTPWIMNDTIRKNITGGIQFDQKWYDYSLHCCCLEDNLERMPMGDQTVAGSNGAALSGGQRQRVALARAVYSRLPVVILDDVLSGLDNKTANTIVTRLFSKEGHFRKAGISVVVATHNKLVLPQMDTVIVLQSGRVTDVGASQDIQARLTPQVLDKSTLFDDDSQDDTIETDKMVDGEEENASASVSRQPAIQDTPRSTRSFSTGPVYRYYLQSAGSIALSLWIFFTFAEAILSQFIPIWINIWTDANEKDPNQKLGYYLGIFALLMVLANLAVVGECWVFFVNIVTQSAFRMHADLLQATIRAPFRFFQTTDTGSITNRFSQDMDLIDMRLPSNAAQFITGASSVITQLIILCVLGKYFTAVVPVLAIVIVIVQRYYLRTSQQVRLIDIEAKAPLYNHFVETVRGVATIRAYGWEPAFRQKQGEILDRAQRPFYMLYCIQQWLELILDLVSGVLAVIIVAVATSTTNSLSAGTLGVALVLILQFNSLLSQSIQAWTMLETSIGAVARVQTFIRETPREETESAAFPDGWPLRGAIQLQGVVARYGPDIPPALSDVSLSISHGEKIAIVGSSGSGKTTIIMALLRMMELSGGDITVDGINISTLTGSKVRSCVNVVPQDPFFMPGSVRFNLDSHNRASNQSVEEALRAVGMWDRLTAGEGPALDKELIASELSQGERQLLCLARAVLFRSPIVILDEATSSVDEHTEAIMQDVIDTHFRDCTVLSVLHRLTYIDRFDRVAVMSRGKLVECDAPQALLGRDSAFRELWRARHGSRGRASS